MSEESFLKYQHIALKICFVLFLRRWKKTWLSGPEERTRISALHLENIQVIKDKINGLLDDILQLEKKNHIFHNIGFFSLSDTAVSASR